ncbi:hypothetical protein [Leisingera sp.]|uniref:hypothetical protein n=1 Tax=Leisingera sp. TaxID=1879318 RepID=UPI003A8CEDD3
MTSVLRRYLGLFLALAVALTAHSAAAAQGGRDATGTMVICTGMGAVVVYTDAEGQPVAAPHYCPDCVTHVLDAVVPPTALPVPGGYAAASVAMDSPVLQGAAPRLHASARAPPAAG